MTFFKKRKKKKEKRKKKKEKKRKKKKKRKMEGIEEAKDKYNLDDALKKVGFGRFQVVFTTQTKQTKQTKQIKQNNKK